MNSLVESYFDTSKVTVDHDVIETCAEAIADETHNLTSNDRHILVSSYFVDDHKVYEQWCDKLNITTNLRRGLATTMAEVSQRMQ
jgi:N12 class adenine-specific DNA methylase